MNYLHKVIKIIPYGSANFILRVEKKNIKFNPGQFFSIGVPEIPINREYSVSSGVDDDYLDFLIREISDGVLSNKLKKLKINDNIKILGPFGEFYLKEFNINDTIDDIIIAFWDDGVHYYKPTKNLDKTINQLSHPEKNIYVVGEMISYKQGWVEGCIESVNRIFK